MKLLNPLLIITLISIVGFSQNVKATTQSIKGSTETTLPHNQAPKITLREALVLAEKYLASKNIDISQHFLSSVELVYNNNEREWKVFWETNIPSDGGQFVVFVTMRKSIRLVALR